MFRWLERRALQMVNAARLQMRQPLWPRFKRGIPWEPQCCHIALPLQDLAPVDVRLGFAETRDQAAAEAMAAAWDRPVQARSDGVYVVRQPFSIVATIFLADQGLWRPRKSRDDAAPSPPLPSDSPDGGEVDERLEAAWRAGGGGSGGGGTGGTQPPDPGHDDAAKKLRRANPRPVTPQPDKPDAGTISGEGVTEEDEMIERDLVTV